MNKIITLISFCFILLFNNGFAQKLEYESTSPWFWGLNIGAAWNTTDVRNQTNWGWGATLGRSFNFDYGNVFSFDIRGRYLGGNWRGQDFDTTDFIIPNKTLSSGSTNYDSLAGYSINNFNSKVHEADLELVLHFNRLVEKTGIDPYVFGGVGVSWYRTKGNLINSSDNLMYDYNSITDYNKSTIHNLLDKSYETSLDGTSGSTYNAKFMPSLGIGLGYFFGKRFSMGIEHKTTFTLVDNFDGYNDPATNKFLGIKFKNDIYHYTNVYFKYYFKNHHYSTTNTNNTNNTNTNVNGGGTGDCQKPIIRITQPSNSQTVKNPTLTFTADVAHTNSASDIQVTVNGTATTNFTYSNQTNKLSGTTYLVEGQNTITITSTNSCGSVTETLFITYTPDCIQPTVRFTNPVNSGTTVSSGTYYVTADILNLPKNEGITFNVNGVSVGNYSFNPQTGKFSATINLKQGQNNLELLATNSCGSNSTATTITYNFNCPAPIILALNTTNGTTVQSSVYTFEASFQNVKSANQISLTLNGVTQNQGQFQSAKGWYQNVLRLVQGQNIIVLTTTNECGTSSQTVVINYNAPCNSPTIAFKNPSMAGTSVTNSTYYVTAGIYNMSGSNGIVFKVNGKSITNYSFNAQTGDFSSTINLQEGANTIELNATNNCGTISQITVVNYNYSCPKPTVQFIYPETNSNVSNSNYTIQALVSNIISSSQVQLYVNGIVQAGGTFNNSNNLYSNTVVLSAGSNVLELKATNNCGTVMTSTSMTYTRVVEPSPVITMTGTCDATVEAGQHYISGIISGVSSNNQVTITVNGVAATNVNYANTTQGLNFGFYLNTTATVGTYVIIVNAQNTSGLISKTCVIRVNQPDENIVICVLEGRVKVTKTIKLSQWPTYQAQGATLGKCPEPIDEDIIICVKSGVNYVTKSIKLSQWPTYQAQGATLGKCPEIIDEDIIICVLEGRIRVTKTIKQSQWPTYQAQGATLGKCPEPIDEDIVICVLQGRIRVTKTIKQSQWTMYQAQGATLGKCPEPIDEDIVICVLQGKIRVTKTIKQSQWTMYQAQGATLGKCPEVVDEKITICHIPPGNPNNPQTIEISLSAWPAHQAHGDQLGKCPEPVDEDIVICVLQGKTRITKTIKQSQWTMYQAQGATLGKCPEVVDEDIVICTFDGKTYTTKTIKQSQWPTYQAQGATLGKCPEPVDPDIVICVLEGNVRVTKTIKQSQWPLYQSQRAVLGACPEVIDEDIVICMKVGDMSRTLTIKQSQWATYQAQGATLGACATVEVTDTTTATVGSVDGTVGKKITICVEIDGVHVTKIINNAEWPTYQAQGATKGECPQEIKIKSTETPKRGESPKGTPNKGRP